MYQDKRIVVVTPAGHRRFLEILFPYVHKQHNIIDEHHLWVNTDRTNDISYMEDIQRRDPSFYKLFYLDIPHRNTDSIYTFWKYATDINTIFIRLDDDIVYISPNLIETLVKFRIENPHYWLVYPIIVNNPMNYNFLSDWYPHIPGWPSSAEQTYAIHKEFFHRLFHGLHNYEFERHEVPLDKLININCICWFGADVQQFQGEVNVKEELDIAVWKPQEYQRPNCICGKAWVVHFSFAAARRTLEQRYPNLLSEYKKLCPITLI